MGTHAMTYLIDDYDGKIPVLSLYRQYDGYVEGGHGQDICNFLFNRDVTDGFQQKSVLTSNGMEDMAAQFTCYFKNDPSSVTGNIYIYPLRKLPTKKQTFEQYRDSYLIPHAIDCGCEYIYIIRQAEDNQIEIQIYCDEKQIFAGMVQAMVEKFGLTTHKALTARTPNFQRSKKF